MVKSLFVMLDVLAPAATARPTELDAVASSERLRPYQHGFNVDLTTLAVPRVDLHEVQRQRQLIVRRVRQIKDFLEICALAELAHAAEDGSEGPAHHGRQAGHIGRPTVNTAIEIVEEASWPAGDDPAAARGGATASRWRWRQRGAVRGLTRGEERPKPRLFMRRLGRNLSVAPSVEALERARAALAARRGHRARGAQLAVGAAAVSRDLRQLGLPDRGIAASRAAGEHRGLTRGGERAELRVLTLEEVAALECERLPQRGAARGTVHRHATRASICVADRAAGGVDGAREIAKHRGASVIQRGLVERRLLRPRSARRQQQQRLAAWAEARSGSDHL